MRAAPEPATEAAGSGPESRQHRKLAALLCADVAGFSRLMRADESGTYVALSRLRTAIDTVVVRRGGRIVSTAGDGLLADFPSIVDALACAVEIQEHSGELNAGMADGRRLELRIGVNLGDVIVAADGDLYGDGVNIAARLQALAPPGGICLSQTVYEQVRNKLDLRFRPLGAHRVKNIAEPVRAYAVDHAASVHAPLPASRRRWLTLPALCAGLTLAAAAAWVSFDTPFPRLPSLGGVAEAVVVSDLAAPARMAERTTVAVLPFRDLSPEPGQEFFSDGVTEDIINALGRFSNLLVSAKSASFQFKGKSLSPEEIGRALKVRYLVEGSVRRAGDRLRLAVALTEAASGVQLWSDTYDTEAKEVFAVQDRIVERIVGATAVRLTRFERDRALRKPTANLSAYEFFLRGRAELTNPTRQANFEARTQLQQALALDPNFAAAYAALGWAHFEAAVTGWSEFREDEMRKAEELSRKALALNANETLALRLLAAVGVNEYAYQRAQAHIDSALATNPSDAENYMERGHILIFAGKPADALPWLEAALRIDGTSARAGVNLGIAKFFLGRYDEAIAAFDQALLHGPGRAVLLQARVVLAASHARLGHQQEADRERSAVLRLSPFFDAEQFAAQFGAEEARQDMIAGLREAGFK
ncbi:MAG: adenylate/guanylate cyclase domain-containing protein [Alphaproteobacteria bacterium]